MGYAYQTRIRVVPPDGPEVVYDFTAFDAASGGGPVLVEVGYDADRVSRFNPVRRCLERHFGFRPWARLVFQIGELEDEAALAAVVSALNLDGAVCYLSLDGGTTERAVVQDSAYGRAPLGGKAPAGIETELSFLAVEQIDAIPPILHPTTGATQW